MVRRKPDLPDLFLRPCCGVRNECDPALVLLSDDVVHHSNIIIGCVRERGHHWVC